MFSDIVNEPDPEAPNEYPLPEDHWMNKPLPEEDDKTLLFVALEGRLYDFIHVLLQAGASAKARNPELGKAPIHVATQTGDSKCLRLLFQNPKNMPDVNATIPRHGRTALHLAVEGEFEDCLNTLLKQPGIDVNVKDNKGKQTPLYMAVKKDSESMARKLIAHGANIQDVSFGKCIADMIAEKMPGFDPKSVPRSVAPLVKQASEATLDRMVEIMLTASVKNIVSQPDLDEYQSLMLQVDTNILNNHKVGGATMLQKCCDEGLHEFAEILLKDGSVNPDGITDTEEIVPVLKAAYNGHEKVIKLLQEYKADFRAISPESKESVLHCILKHGTAKDEGFLECLSFVLGCEDIEDDIRRIVNKRDANNNTALHYATQMWPQEMIRKLLEIGANIGMKNQWDEIPISKIDPGTMEDFLDEFCITSKHDVNHENFEITFNYSFLAPPKEDLPAESQAELRIEDEDDAENQKLNSKDGNQKFALPETQSLWHMGQSKEHRHLLKHPVITSFLYLKWGRIRRYFNRNVRFYLLFVFILTWYIFENFGGEAIRTVGKDTIPFWHLLFIIFAVLIFIFVLRDWIMDIKDLMRAEKVKRNNPGGGEEPLSSSKLFCVIIFSNWVEVLLILFMGTVGLVGYRALEPALVALLLLLVIREFFQVTVSLKRYIFSPENWMEVSMIILITIIIAAPDDYYDMKRHLSAISIVLSWAELITLIGKHPKLTRYNVYVTMFYKVMGTFFFFLVWYMFFIIAFGLGFYIMLHKEPKDVGEDDYIYFNSPWLALVKTSTMFVGELEFSDIPVDITSSLGILGYLFFLSFVFLIVVVLMNLLNGLAVSDTGVIQEKAEIVAYISRVETISYTESVLLGDPFNFLSNWPALKWIINMPSCSFCSQLYRNKLMKRIFHKITGATGILLFYSFLPEKKLTLTPNGKNRNCSSCLNVSKNIFQYPAI